MNMVMVTLCQSDVIEEYQSFSMVVNSVKIYQLWNNVMLRRLGFLWNLITHSYITKLNEADCCLGKSFRINNNRVYELKKTTVSIMRLSEWITVPAAGRRRCLHAEITLKQHKTPYHCFALSSYTLQDFV